MKKLIGIFCWCLVAIISQAQSPLEISVDFDVKQMPMAEALVLLGKTAGVPISFSNNILPKDALVTLRVKDAKVKTILSKILLDTDIQFKAVGAQVILFYKKRVKRNFTISGYIEDIDSGEKLISANVYDKVSGKGTTSNEYGFYSITIPEGKVELVGTYLGFKSNTQKFELKINGTLTFSLEPNLTLQEIIVTPESFQGIEASDPISSNDIPITLMKKLPSLGGEVDLFRMAEFIPGVQSGSDGLGGLHVRGGSADQNLILMDGVPIYNAGHSLGIFSVFNSEAIQSVQLYKGGFPARYGGRLSSIMDVRTRDGNKKRWTGNVKAGLIASSARIEGPIIKDKASILITARRTLLDSFIKDFTRKSKEEDEYFKDVFGVNLQGFTTYNFFDLNAKLNFSIGKKDNFFFSYYTGGDDLYDEDLIVGSQQEDFVYSDKFVQEYNWGNQIGMFRWNHIFKNKLFLNTSLTFSNYQFDSEENVDVDFIFRTSPPINIFIAQAYHSTLQDWGAKLDFNYSSSENHLLRFGINSTLHTFQPGAFGADLQINDETLFEENIDSFLNATQITVHEHNAYFEDEFTVGEKLKFNLGVLGNVFVAEDKTFYSIQPRVSVNYLINKQLSLKGGLSKMVQPLHLLSGSDAGFPNDLWLPSTKLVAPQTSWQSVLGMQYQPHKAYQFNVEVYYKKLNNLITYLDNSSLRTDLSNPGNFTFSPISTQNWESQITLGEGWNYGIEFQLEKNIGRTTGLISYTYAHADRRFDDLNIGERFPYRYDRRHNFNIAINHRFTKWLDVSCNWIYGTGLSTLIPVSTYQLGELTLFNNEFVRLPANHRLDAGINFYFDIWKLKHKVYLGGYNIYNRANPQYFQLKSIPIEGSDPDNIELEYQIFQGTFLPFLPSLSYTISF